MRFPPPSALAVAVATFALATCGVAGASGSRHRPCPPRGARPIAHDRLVTVYSTGVGLDKQVEACLRAGGRRMTLLAKPTRPGGPLGLRLRVEALSGSIVACLISSFGVDSGSTGLLIADVASRRVLREASAGRYVDAGILGSESVSKLVLGREGAVGWIMARRERGASATTYIVRGAGRTGPASTLDEGPDIGATSLSLTGHTLTWWHGGIEKSAALP